MTGGDRGKDEWQDRNKQDLGLDFQRMYNPKLQAGCRSEKDEGNTEV